MKTLIIYSGGMDSTSLLAKLIKSGDRIVALGFDYGSKHNEKENYAALQITMGYSIAFEVIELPFFEKHIQSNLMKGGGEIPEGHYEDESMKQTVVPGRNTIMLSIAMGIAESFGCDRVAYGAHSGDHAIYPDCRESFLVAMNRTFKEATDGKVSLYAPFIRMDKGDVCDVGVKLKAPLHLSWTCYKGLEEHCGKCGACVERREAFAKHGHDDPTTYASDNDD